MSTHNIQFHDQIRKFPWIFVFLSYRENFVGTQKNEFALAMVNEPSAFELLRFDCVIILQVLSLVMSYYCVILLSLLGFVLHCNHLVRRRRWLVCASDS